MQILGSSELLEDVHTKDLCVDCGACVGLCPYFVSHNGKIARLFACTLSQGRCHAHCPKTQVDLNELSTGKTGALVTIENHSVINGLGSAVSEVLTARCPVPLERIGVQDEFGEVGTIDSLMKRFGMTAADIVAAAHKAIARKK